MPSVYVYVFTAESLNHLKLKNSLVKNRIKSLQNELLVRFGLDYARSGNYRRGYIRLRQKKAKTRSEILFYFCKSTKGIYFQEIVLPNHLRRQGIGTFCVDWLKQFAEEFGIRYIVLGSRPEAVEFWRKMGFVEVPYEEAQANYPWMSTFPNCFQK